MRYLKEIVTTQHGTFTEVTVGEKDTVKVYVATSDLRTGIVYSGDSIREAIGIYMRAQGYFPTCAVMHRERGDDGWVRDPKYHRDRHEEDQKALASGKYVAAYERDLANDEAHREMCLKNPDPRRYHPSLHPIEVELYFDKSKK